MTRVGVDTGGTFTDFVRVDAGGVRIGKRPSTPRDPARAVLEGLAELAPGGADELSIGTTVAVNALLERRLARTALVTNRGFRDAIEIGRQDRPSLYDLFVDRPAPLVPRTLRFEVDERTLADGRRLRRPSGAELSRLRESLARARVEAVAICLLHSYRNPMGEREVGRALRSLGVPLVLSSDLLPEFREFERFSTTVANAALVPIASAYFGGIVRAAQGGRVSVLQSDGGATSPRLASREPVRVLFSGPAAGVVGATRAAREAGLRRVLTLDMGGTSTDVSIVEGEPRIVSGTAVAGCPVRVPAVEIHSIGCGGGSIVRLDAGGALRVGPESAGADPGPVACGRGTEPTVTDAHVVLGTIGEGTFLGGEVKLDRGAAREAFRKLGRRVGLSPEAFAAGVLEVAEVAMERALRVISLERGRDPRDFGLVAFGGAGGLHACGLASRLGIRTVLVPRDPGALSALGAAAAPAVREVSRSLLAPLGDLRGRRAEREWRLLEESAARAAREAAPGRAIRVARLLDLRYRGQSHELRIPGEGNLASAFHRAHRDRYGYALGDRDIEVVNLRVRATAGANFPPSPRIPLRSAPRRRARPAFLGGRPGSLPVFDRTELGPGARIRGPAVIEEFTATTFVAPGWEAAVLPRGHLRLRPSRRHRAGGP